MAKTKKVTFTRDELVTLVATELSMTKTETASIFKTIESTIRKVTKEDKDRVLTFADAEFGTKFVKGRSGTIKQKNDDGSEKLIPWTTEDHYEGYASAKPALSELR